MKYIQYTYVDAVTGISIAAQPAANGPAHPEVNGLEFVWARESAYPTNVPEFFGTCPDSSDIDIDGVTGEFIETDWLQMQADEMNARLVLDVLSVDTWQIEADSADVATVTYTSNDTVHFVADGLLYSVEPVDSIATLEISADAPGPIPVQVQDKQIMLTAVEVPA